MEVVDRLLTGTSPIKVYREYRGLSQKELAAATDISPIYLSQIETGRRFGSAKTLASIAQALDVSLDDLV
ncbi:MAG: helix-turn-helix transcriptional regulator [Caldilineaceae bacterium SB0670_bin_27]|uniref:Helix-turn-helix transcriptional regulator n=1 Tax=Caldilineaceae bacterium SB0664_bin_27 TaxID=2605260 RepID=A0A6B0YLR5_9CHLR|nr:helix-turn-helix transcriptional regulator [Caldilineaceae bacterium SB0664_bin_27]MYJ77360.1 helix-turn-helix transcriptional regulator [Caldilineaceae bacterium SB0670_bin_27]